MFFYICFSHSLPHKNVFVHTLLKNFCKISKFFWQFAYFPLPSAPIFCPTVKNQQNLSPDNTKKAPPSGDFCTLPSLAPPPRLFSGSGDLYLRSYMQGNCRPLAPLCKGSCQRQLTEGLSVRFLIYYIDSGLSYPLRHFVTPPLTIRGGRGRGQNARATMYCDVYTRFARSNQKGHR